jgi:AraC-like DNA-binding protein
MAVDHANDEASLAAALKKLGAVTGPVVGLFDHLQDGYFWIKDREGYFRWVNTAVVLRRGLRSRAEMAGKRDVDMYPPARASQYISDDEYVLAGNSIRNRVEQVEINGVVRWYSTAKVPLRDRRGRVVGSAGLSIPVQAPDGGAGRDAFLGAAIQYINEHFGEPIANTTLARACGMSLGNFQRQFRLTYNCSPHTYLRELRVRLSCRLLAHSTRSLAAIAEDHGFADQSHYTKEFRRMMKETPRAYRRRFQK